MIDSFVVIIALLYFFFSSRRRHTRLQGDWSSDVCSSDLIVRMKLVGMLMHVHRLYTPYFKLSLNSIFSSENGASLFIQGGAPQLHGRLSDRKSTRLNSSHLVISYAVFCLKKKKKHNVN